MFEIPLIIYNKQTNNNKILLKYKESFDLLDKYINNNIIYNIIYEWGTYYKNKFYKLHSQINIYEGIFISEIIQSYIKSSMKNINVLEIGCAYGTSAIFILNMLNRYNKKTNYHVIDPNQDIQWNNVGLYNIARVKKKHINIRWLKGNSDIVMKYLTKFRMKYDIIFIDGGHSYNTVMTDCFYADKLLKKNGIVIHDDVLHNQVQSVIYDYYENNPDYSKVLLEYSKSNNKHIIIKDTKKWVRKGKYHITSFLNPVTMYGFKKLVN